MSSSTMTQVKKSMTPVSVPAHSPALANRQSPHEHVSDAPVGAGAGHDFGQVSVQAPVMEGCPLRLSSPTHCPFGGACHTCPVSIQTKLTIGQPGDEYEQEADRVAEQVMRMPEPRVQRQEEEPEEEEPIQTKPLADQITPLVQRQTEMEEEEEEPIQPKLVDTVQRQCVGCEDEKDVAVQTQPIGGQSSQASPDLAAQVGALRQSGGQPLPAATRAFFEPRFGRDFSEVRVHTDAQAAESTRALNAQAYAVGRDVAFGAGQYAPDTADGRRLLAHELTHVMQQRQRKTSNLVIQRALFLAYSGYRGRCECGQALSNNCAHYLSDALIRAGYSELDGGTGQLYRRHKGRVVCTAGRPVRAKELRDWFASKATTTLPNRPESSIPGGYWAVYQERASDGQGHVLIHHHSGAAYTWRGTGDYPSWRISSHFNIPSAPGDWNLPRSDVRIA